MSSITDPTPVSVSPEGVLRPEKRLRSVGILGIGTEIPERVLSNADLSAMRFTSPRTFGIGARTLIFDCDFLPLK